MSYCNLHHSCNKSVWFGLVWFGLKWNFWVDLRMSSPAAGPQTRFENVFAGRCEALSSLRPGPARTPHHDARGRPALPPRRAGRRRLRQRAPAPPGAPRAPPSCVRPGSHGPCSHAVSTVISCSPLPTGAGDCAAMSHASQLSAAMLAPTSVGWGRVGSMYGACAAAQWRAVLAPRGPRRSAAVDNSVVRIS